MLTPTRREAAKSTSILWVSLDERQLIYGRGETRKLIRYSGHKVGLRPPFFAENLLAQRQSLTWCCLAPVKFTGTIIHRIARIGVAHNDTSLRLVPFWNTVLLPDQTQIHTGHLMDLQTDGRKG